VPFGKPNPPPIPASDGENDNIGFVSATDTPCVEMVEAAKMVHAEAYAHRARF
jgi:hypothetical protein